VNASVGKKSATGLARLEAHVVMVYRSKERGELAKGSGNDHINLFISDLSEMGQLKTLAESLLSSLQSINVPPATGRDGVQRREATPPRCLCEVSAKSRRFDT
jgi:NAD(P)-dependent dehydrogenase (short-subunit alcohol dehydrogenase family)